uniref:EOG090X07PD n=1 Tax=Daphnia magna TaxID=35525 RepID=A0A4Y7MHK6_9CRUS|nr:EOG090X07PD [Daphnia magna]
MTDNKYKMVGNVPSDISVVRFATVRAQEIVALTKMIENPQTTKLIFQKLPCHMRRRAMSHNPNRMPRLLREAHKSQMAKSGPALKPIRPRRKYRRRPSRLLEEYKKRSSKMSWLETHLWHAKRFHMTAKWGYRLPEKSCARGHRFCHRSVAEHCLLVDISYLCCIEIQGPQNAIIHELAPLCDPKTGPTFGASSFLNGTREGRVTIFQRNSFSRGPIGLVTFLWRHGETPDMRTLWIWCHPAFYEQFLVELNSSYGSNSDSLIEQTKIKITLNKGKLNRFRLRGPFAHSVISNLLDKEIRKVFIASQSPGFVAGVDVRDPRMILPQSRVKEHISMPSQCETVITSRSRLWDASVRDQIAQVRTSFPDYVVNGRRSQLLVPGSELPLQPEEIPIPLLIVNASHESSDFVPGCDVIFPAGWATAFWLALIYSGGHAGGLKDVESMNFEYRICSDLCLEVDSNAGKTAAAEQKVKFMEDYFRKPPKTRTNFIKLATPFPFSIDWNRLLIDWGYQVEQGFTVLRDKKLLNTLSLNKQNLLSEFTFSYPHLVAVTIRLKHDFCITCVGSKSWNDGISEGSLIKSQKEGDITLPFVFIFKFCNILLCYFFEKKSPIIFPVHITLQEVIVINTSCKWMLIIRLNYQHNKMTFLHLTSCQTIEHRQICCKFRRGYTTKKKFLWREIQRASLDFRGKLSGHKVLGTVTHRIKFFCREDLPIRPMVMKIVPQVLNPGNENRSRNCVTHMVPGRPTHSPKYLPIGHGAVP